MGDVVVCAGCGRGFDPRTHSQICPHDQIHGSEHDTVHTLVQTRKEKVRVVTTTGWWFDMDKLPDFNMLAFAGSIRSTGYLLNDRLYQPAEGIATIFTYFEDTPPKETGVVLDFPGKGA